MSYYWKHVDMTGRINWSPQVEDDIMETGERVQICIDAENCTGLNDLMFMTEHGDHIGPDPLIGECNYCDR